MPRPQPQPEDRQRSTKACCACKSSKIRCNSELPCASCVQRGRASTCGYSEIDRRRRHHRSSTAPRVRVSGSSMQDVPASEPIVSPTSGTSTSQIAPNPVFRTPSSTTADVTQGNVPLPRDHLSEASEQVHVGETESLSFLDFLTKTLRPFVGNVRFTESEPQNVTNSDISAGVQISDYNVPVEQMYFLLDSYFETTSGLLDLFTAEEIDSLIVQRATSSSSESAPSTPRREDLAALDVALAIGAQTQAHAMRSTDPNLHVALFSRARQIAFEDMLASPSPSLVRLFLLLSFYMLGTCRRNGASMYLGVASKAADLLGFQDSLQRHGQTNDEPSRERIGNSLTVINVLSSFILGRRQSTPLANTEPTTVDNAVVTGAGHGQNLFSAILEGCLHVERIVQSLRSQHLLHIPTAEDRLEQLRHWTQGLSDPVRRFAFSQRAVFDSADRQAIIGHLHLSCVYHFAVLLITRPFLIAYLLSRLRGRAPDHLIDDPDEATDVTIKNNKVSKLAQVCVSSATCMIEALQKVKASGFSFGNLCLLKGWVFGSGLVLGFSMFAGEPRLDIQEAFEGARDVLADIATLCPQAKVYHGILTDFSEAVSKYRQLVALEIRKTVHHYLDPTPFLEVTLEKDQQGLSPFSLHRATSGIGASRTRDVGHGEEQADLVMDADLQIIWPDLDLRLIDTSLIATTEPFEGMFFNME